MNIPVENWYEAIFQRRSRRQFDGRYLSQDLVSKLKDLGGQLQREIPGARAVVVTENPDPVFKGAVGSYGKIKNAPAYVAFIGNMQNPHVQEQVGYLGEFFILEATALGMATCWVGGFFRPEMVQDQVQLKEAEQVLAVSPIGYVQERYSLEEKIMSGFAKSHKRKNLQDLILPEQSIPLDPWMKTALEAARLAPSAVNRQPWRFSVDNGSIIISLDNNRDVFHVSKRLDCGIAMAHVEIGAKYAGISGRWEYLTDLDVARFIPAS